MGKAFEQRKSYANTSNFARLPVTEEGKPGPGPSTALARRSGRLAAKSASSEPHDRDRGIESQEIPSGWIAAAQEAFLSLPEDDTTKDSVEGADEQA